jgi:hypothetical protein
MPTIGDGCQPTVSVLDCCEMQQMMMHYLFPQSNSNQQDFLSSESHWCLGDRRSKPLNLNVSNGSTPSLDHLGRNMNDLDPDQKLCKKKHSWFSLECMRLEVSVNHLFDLFDAVEMAAGLFDLECEIGEYEGGI